MLHYKLSKLLSVFKFKKKIIIFLILFIISPYFINVSRARTVSLSVAHTQNPILFLHGWTGSKYNWGAMINRFEAEGWINTTLFAFTFANSSHYSEEANIRNAKQIEEWVDQILNQTGAEKVDLIGHSMGGLSSRYYIKFLGGINKVDDFVCMGSPQHAITGASGVFQPNNTFIFNLNEDDETPGGILNDTIGARVDPVSGVVYNSIHIPGNLSYTSIYSTGDTICPYITSPLDGAHNIELTGINHNDHLSDENVYELVKAAVYDSIQNGNNPQLISGYNIFLITSVLIIFSLVVIKEKHKM